MSNITILSIEQIFRLGRLDIFEKCGTKAAITDFAILLGGFVSGDSHASSGNELEDRTGYYWTKSSDGLGHIFGVDHNGSRSYHSSGRTASARPVLLYSDINLISKDVVSGCAKISEIEYGEYPQKAVNKKLNDSLEKEYRKSRLKPTGKTYATDSRIWSEQNEDFLLKEHIEHEYEGKRYVRVKANFCDDKQTLSDGSIVKNEDYVWVEVEPISWLVDEKTGIVVSKKLLFSGVRFDGKDRYDGNFETTEMKMFLDNYFSKEIGVTDIKVMESDNKNVESIVEKEFETEEELDDYIATKIAEARKRLTLLGKK